MTTANDPPLNRKEVGGQTRPVERLFLPRGEAAHSTQVTTEPTAPAGHSWAGSEQITTGDPGHLLPRMPPRCPEAKGPPRRFRLDGSKVTLADYWRLCPEPASF